jgi:flagellar hook-basal body complex protein FliE
MDARMNPAANLVGRLYADAQTAAKPKAPDVAKAPPFDFGAALRESALDTLRAVRASEETVKAGLAGRADPQSVVQAIAQTEIAVETAVTVRDRVVEAYNEILRMPV